MVLSPRDPGGKSWVSLSHSYVHLSDLTEDSDGELAVLEPITMTTNNLTGQIQVGSTSEDWEGVGQALWVSDDIERVWMQICKSNLLCSFCSF